MAYAVFKVKLAEVDRQQSISFTMSRKKDRNAKEITEIKQQLSEIQRDTAGISKYQKEIVSPLTEVRRLQKANEKKDKVIRALETGTKPGCENGGLGKGLTTISRKIRLNDEREWRDVCRPLSIQQFDNRR